jgi:hypothetical protein
MANAELTYADEVSHSTQLGDGYGYGYGYGYGDGDGDGDGSGEL